VSGYTFDHWSIDETNQGQGVNPVTISMNEPHTAIAHYLAHDIAVTNVTPSKTVVGQNYSLSIHVTVENQGDTTEAFNVTAYCQHNYYHRIYKRHLNKRKLYNHRPHMGHYRLC